MPVGAAQMMNDTAAFAEKAQDRREHRERMEAINVKDQWRTWRFPHTRNSLSCV